MTMAAAYWSRRNCTQLLLGVPERTDLGNKAGPSTEMRKSLKSHLKSLKRQAREVLPPRAYWSLKRPAELWGR